jgi:hypothetical protein
MQFGTTKFGGRDDGDIGTAYGIEGLNAYFSYMRIYSRYRRSPGPDFEPCLGRRG